MARATQGKSLCVQNDPGKGAFFLVTDSEQAEFILKDNVRHFLREKGLEVQTPPEHVAMRTVLVNGLGWNIAAKSEEDIKHKIQSEYPDWKLKKVLKIPGNDKLMKFVPSLLVRSLSQTSESKNAQGYFST